MRHSFFSRLFLGNLLLIVLIVGVGGIISYRRLNAVYLADGENHQRTLVRFAQKHFEDTWSQVQQDAGLIDRECKQFGVESPMRLTVIAVDGRVLGDSEADVATMANHKTADRPEVMAALAGRPGRDARTSETLGREFRYLARPIHAGPEVVGVVRVAMPVLAIARRQAFVRDALLAAALTSVGAAVLLALLLSWIWYAPLRQITRTARTLAAGDLSRRAAISGTGELSQLAAALNEMRDSIRTQIDQIAAQRQNLVAVVDNLRDGVIAVDAAGHVVLMNASAKELTGAGADAEVAGRHLQAVVRIGGIVDVYREIARSASPVTRQVEAEVAGRRSILDVDAVPLGEGSPENLAALLVVRDVTHLVRMAAVKAEFVANASHELRTPLATIRAAVDSLATIEAGESDELARISEILDRHTTRLEEMTNDLLSLHLVESTHHRPRLKPVRLASLAEWVRENYAARAAAKGVRLSAECDQPGTELLSDVTLIQLVLQNLLDNAIKFTADGGVTCRFEAEEEAVRFVVSDTGCGIAPDMQDRVFERFFQVDPARSGGQKVRGTGLGLAIVKHAAERLGAAVDLQSRLGEGTAVTVTVPRKPEGR